MVRNSADGADRKVMPRSVVLGEMFRRFMLRPESTAIAAVVILFIVFTALNPQLFPSKLTYISIMAVASELGILSIGVTLLMIGGHFDLSVGAVLGLTSYVCVVLMRDFGLSPLIAAPIAVAVGAVLGAINGYVVVRFRIHSFVVTLGTMLIWRGVLIALTGVIVVGAVILNTDVARRMARSKPLGGFKRSSEDADAAIKATVQTSREQAG